MKKKCLLIFTWVVTGFVSIPFESLASSKLTFSPGDVVSDLNAPDGGSRPIVTDESARSEVYRRSAIERMRAHESAPLVLSQTPTEEIANKLLISEGSGRYWDTGLRELSERPVEVRQLVEDHLALDEIPLYEVGVLPILARQVSLQFQTETVVELLRHPSLTKYDNVLLSEGPYLRFLIESPADAERVLKELLSKGRINAGSDSEATWKEAIAESWASRKRLRNIADIPHPSPKDPRDDFLSENDDVVWGFSSIISVLVLAITVMVAVFFLSRKVG